MAAVLDEKLHRLDETDNQIRNQEVDGKYYWELGGEGTSRMAVEEGRTSQVQKRV